MFVYSILAQLNGPISQASNVPYYNYLADAFIHGQLHLRLLPPITLDLINFHENLYLYWPPFPAILLLPLIIIFGVQFSDVLFTIIIGTLNVTLVALILRTAYQAHIIKISKELRALLLLLFAFGTVHLTLASKGQVWYTSQLIGFMCVAFAYLFCLRLKGKKAFLLVGLALTCTMLTRNHLIFAGIWPLWYLYWQHRKNHIRYLITLFLWSVIPIAIGAGLLLTYNHARFNHALETGLDYHNMAPIFLEDYQKYGPFHLHYVPINIYYQYIAYPFPFTPTSKMGGSLFLLTPTFFAVFWRIIHSKSRTSVLAFTLSIILVNIPILLLFGTGYVQFGPRYTLDFTLPLLLLTAIGLSYWPPWLIRASVIISIIHYSIGTVYLLAT